MAQHDPRHRNSLHKLSNNEAYLNLGFIPITTGRGQQALYMVTTFGSYFWLTDLNGDALPKDSDKQLSFCMYDGDTNALLYYKDIPNLVTNVVMHISLAVDDYILKTRRPN